MKSQRWYAAIRAANSRPRTAEEKARLSELRKGIQHSAKTKQKMSNAHMARRTQLPDGACVMCGSLKHTEAQHHERLAAARRKSPVWKKAIVDANRLAKTGTHASDATRAKMSASQFVAQNKPEQKAIIAARSKEMWAGRTVEQIDEIAEKISKAQRGRPLDYSRYGGWYNGVDRRIWMRSSYEIKFAEWCDEHSIRWEYEPRSFFVGRGNWHGSTETPDFYLPDYDRWIETKGYLRDDNKRKLRKFFKLYPQITKRWTMLCRDDLQALGINVS